MNLTCTIYSNISRSCRRHTAQTRQSKLYPAESTSIVMAMKMLIKVCSRDLDHFGSTLRGACRQAGGVIRGKTHLQVRSPHRRHDPG